MLPNRGFVVGVVAAAVSVVACTSGPVAAPTPSATPSDPEAPIVGGAVPTLPTDAPVDLECTWVPNDLAEAAIDPDRLTPLDGVLEAGRRLFAVGGDAAFASEDGLRWTRMSLGDGRSASGLGFATGAQPTILADHEVLSLRDGVFVARTAPKSSGTILTGATTTRNQDDGNLGVVVGWDSTDDGDRVAVWHLVNGKWRVIAMPSYGDGLQRLNGVSRWGGDPVAVGVAERNGVGSPLVLRFDGKTWRQHRVTPPAKSTWTELNAIAGFDGGYLAVGEAWMPGGVRTVAYRSETGRGWTSVPVPQPGLRGQRGGFAPPYGPTLRAIGTDGTTVYAVGGASAEHPQGDAELLEVPFIARWNGTRFVEESVVDPDGGTDPRFLFGVAVRQNVAEKAIAVGIDGTGALVLERTCLPA